MKARIHHNLTDQELERVIDQLQKSLGSKKEPKRLRLPAANPAQAALSEKVVHLYQKIMIESLGKKLKSYLEEVQK